jgi:hypothetical protein
MEEFGEGKGFRRGRHWRSWLPYYSFSLLHFFSYSFGGGYPGTAPHHLIYLDGRIFENIVGVSDGVAVAAFASLGRSIPWCGFFSSRSLWWRNLRTGKGSSGFAWLCSLEGFISFKW